MVTTSIHKPGWRSRRRSRLSLVERAVPRLGLPAGSKTVNAAPPDTTKEADSPATPKTGTDLRALESAFKTDTALSITGMQLDRTSQSEEAAEYVPDTLTDVHEDKAAPAESPAAAADVSAPEPVTAADDAGEAGAAPERDDEGRTSIIETQESDGIDGDDPLPADLETSLETTVPEAVMSAWQATVDDEPAAAGGPDAHADADGLDDADAVPAPLALAPAGVTLAPKVDSAPETSDALRAPENKAPVEPKLALDWAHLIESGYIDPRDRGRPLPAKMDPIIRALVRQALSDQSSWRDRIILVTSPKERAGKSTAAVNFAFGLTTVGGHRAVLVEVDADGLGAVDHLGGRDRIGITDALGDESLTMDELVITTDLDRLTLVASGGPDEALIDHLASRRMLQILRHLTEAPETILVIDAPPILVSQEAAVLSVVAGQVVMAVEAGRTTADEIEHALQRLGERHNVSLVLSENSGVRPKDSSAAGHGNQPATANRRPPDSRRHLPKAAAAAAGLLALGLSFSLQQGHGRYAVAAPAVIGSEAGPWTADGPDRWRAKPVSKAEACLRMCW